MFLCITKPEEIIDLAKIQIYKKFTLAYATFLELFTQYAQIQASSIEVPMCGIMLLHLAAKSYMEYVTLTDHRISCIHAANY